MKFRCIILLAFFLANCTQHSTEESSVQPDQAFQKDLDTLKDYFHIPGLAALITNGEDVIFESYSGYANLEAKDTVDENTIFPIASITKTFASVLTLKLVEEGKLSLDEPIKNFLPDWPYGDSVQVQHLLSHTSQGPVGEHFYYSGPRYGILTQLIAERSGMSFDAYLKKTIIEPLQLTTTGLLDDKAEGNPKIAKPYVFEGSIEPGFMDLGFSSAAGMTSTVRDLAKFDKALTNNQIIKETSKNKIFQPFQEGLPYGLGIFTQSFEGEKLIWGYGQYDCYSSLYLKVPSKDLTLILLANNNLMSDPARLIYGDVTYSLFAISFLKHFIFKEGKEPILINPEKITITSNSPVFRQQLLSQALAASFMSRFDPKAYEVSIQLLEKIFKAYPDYLSYGTPSLLHNISFLKTVAFHKDLGKMNKFDNIYQQIGNKLLKNDPTSPYLHHYMGELYNETGPLEKARFHYQSIVDASNFEKFWYTSTAENWLKQHPAKD